MSEPTKGPFRKGSCVSNTFKTSLVLTTDEDVEIANWCHAQGKAEVLEMVKKMKVGILRERRDFLSLGSDLAWERAYSLGLVLDWIDELFPEVKS